MHLLIIIIIISGKWQRLLSITLLNLPDQSDIQLQLKVLQVLEIIRYERQYENILIYGIQPCVFHEVLPQLELPTVLLSLGSTIHDWNFNTETLLLCCGEEAEQEHNNSTLLKLQQARRLVYLEKEQEPQQLCETYFAREQHNVAMLNSEGHLFSCRCFQDENNVQLFPNDSNFSAIYVEQFLNMKGAIIRSELDQLPPRSMLYRDAEGKIRMVGYVANLINTFVERVNATLELRDDYEFGKIIHNTKIYELVRNNEIDMGTVLMSLYFTMDMDYLTYPYLSTSLCFMVPLPKPLPYMDIYTMIIIDDVVLYIIFALIVIFTLMINYSRHLPWRQLGLANILLNDRCLRGLLGQSFPLARNPSKHLKAICMLLFFSSLMTSTMYGCYLQSFFTHPPPEPGIHSMADFIKSRYKLAIDPYTFKEMVRKKFLKPEHMHKVFIVEDLNELVKMRDIFNDSFVYSVGGTRFHTYAEQQKIFARPVFYYSQNLCLHRYVSLFIPIRRSLPYRQKFEEHMSHIHEFGLSKFWIERSFYVMVDINQIVMKDYSNTMPDEAEVYLRDLTWILKVYGTANVLAIICFAFEYFWSKYRKKVCDFCRSFLKYDR